MSAKRRLSDTIVPTCSHSSHSSQDIPTLPALLLSLRILVLSHLSDLENRLAQFDPGTLKNAWTNWELEFQVLGPAPESTVRPPLQTSFSDSDVLRRKEHSADATSATAAAAPPTDVLQDILAVLDSIRTDVCRYLPDIDFDLPSLPNSFDFELPSLSHLQLPDALLARLRAHKPSLPSSFIPSLSSKLHQLSLLAAPPARLTELLSSLSSNFDFTSSQPQAETSRKGGHEGGSSGQSTHDHEGVPLLSNNPPSPASLAHALAACENGTRLIKYTDLPQPWRNNEFVVTGYRFIPLARWHNLLLSPFTVHNETCNILTHLFPTLLIPLLFLPAASIPSLPMPVFGFPAIDDVTLDPLPRIFFLAAAICCLACSVVWHTVCGCADLDVCEWGARVDYVGIGWLISASVTSVTYYGFYCTPSLSIAYASLCLFTGTLGSFLPFQSWFNQRRNKKWRIAFYLGLCFSGVFPLAHLAYARGVEPTLAFFQPVTASVFAYVFGLLFYAFHFPECAFPGRFDYFGASHQIWHVCIIAAIWLHYRAIASMHVAAEEFACPVGEAGGWALDW